MSTLTPSQFQTLQSYFSIFQKNQRINKNQLYQMVCLAGFNPLIPKDVLKTHQTSIGNIDEYLQGDQLRNSSLQIENSLDTSSEMNSFHETYFDFKEALLYIKKHNLLHQDSFQLLELSLKRMNITTFDDLVNKYLTTGNATQLRQNWDSWKIHNGYQESPTTLAKWVLGLEN